MLSATTSLAVLTGQSSFQGDGVFLLHDLATRVGHPLHGRRGTCIWFDVWTPELGAADRKDSVAEALSGLEASRDKVAQASHQGGKLSTTRHDQEQWSRLGRPVGA